MACSDCYPGNSSVIIAGENINISGAGTASSPMEISAFGSQSGDSQASTSYSSGSSISLFGLVQPATFRVELTGDVDITPPDWAFNTAGSITLVLVQGAGGSHTVDFAGAGILTAGGAPVVLSATAGAIDLVRIFWTGVEWIVTDVVLDVS